MCSIPTSMKFRYLIYICKSYHQLRLLGLDNLVPRSWPGMKFAATDVSCLYSIAVPVSVKKRNYMLHL